MHREIFEVMCTCDIQQDSVSSDTLRKVIVGQNTELLGKRQAGAHSCLVILHWTETMLPSQLNK